MKYAGYAAAIVAFLVAQFWGVPHYIKAQVQMEVAIELAKIAELEGTPEEITALEKTDAIFIERMDNFEDNQKDLKTSFDDLRKTIIDFYRDR